MNSAKQYKEQLNKQGVFYTDPKLATLMRSYFPNDVKEIYDPTCGSAGDVGIAKDDSFFTSRVYWIESDYIFPKYLYYFLLNKQEFLHSKCVGLIPSLSKKVIENLEINIPPKEKQMEIVNKLESFENQYIDSFDKINKKEKKFVEDMIFEKYLKKLK